MTGAVIPYWATWVVGAVMGVCLIPLLIAWQGCYNVGFRATLLYGGASSLLSVAISRLIMTMPLTVAALSWCACAAAGTMTAVLGFLRGPGRKSDAPHREPEDGEGQRDPACQEEGSPSPVRALGDLLSSLWLPFLGMLLCMVIVCSREVKIDGSVLNSSSVGLFFASAVAIAASLVRTKAPLSLCIDRVVIPTCIACLAILSGAPVSNAFGKLYLLLANLPLMLASIYFMASITAIKGFSRILIASVTLAACCLSMLVGSLFAFWSPASDEYQVALLHVLTSVFYAVVIIDLVVTSWRATTDGGASQMGERDGADLYRARVEDFARAHDLTAREQEVALYLGRGYNAAFIAKALSVSNATARTHMHNIYRKAGVSSQRELMLAIGSPGGGE